ncbi:MAG: DUF349 domain-containing protein [Bacteroidales bacterium]
MMDAHETKSALNVENLQNSVVQQLAEDVEKAYQQYTCKSEVITRMTELLDLPVDDVKAEVDYLKQSYYRIRKQEAEFQKSAYVTENNTEEGFILSEDELEEDFKELLARYKNNRATVAQEKQRVKEENLAKKLQIIDQLKAMTEDADDVSKNYTEFQALQKTWREITDLPASEVAELWKNYHHYVETFYELLKINKELRDYDYKRNYEHKSALCEAAERIAEQDEIVSAFHQLQKLHDEWREIGPVSKEMRDELWVRFKNASTQINKKHQAHFETLKEKEIQNEADKVTLCTTVENLLTVKPDSFAKWEEATQSLLAAQAEWKTLGFAPKKVNNALYERFRTACNAFFDAKAEFYASIKSELDTNLKRKIALCEKAELLKDSSEWRKTTDKLIALQKEWKTIGATPRKHSDEVWKRFIAACDSFFERKNKEQSSQKDEEKENLAKKHALIAQLKSLMEQEIAIDQVREIISQFNAVGHVPFKDKDKVYKEFHALVDDCFAKLNLNKSKSRLDSFSHSVDKLTTENNKSNLLKEREKLMRTFDHIRSELKNYENNILFLSSSSKSGNSLVKDLEKKIEKLKEDMNHIVQKVDIIDNKLN